MPTDIYIDTRTNDFVDDGNGGWLEVDDARTSVRLQLDCEFRKWWGDPAAGSRFAEMRRDAVTPEQLRDEALRALQPIVNDGAISDLSVSVDDATSQPGLVQLLLLWRDRSSNRPVDLVYRPYEVAA